jgi:hypothetical protein
MRWRHLGSALRDAATAATRQTMKSLDVHALGTHDRWRADALLCRPHRGAARSAGANAGAARDGARPPRSFALPPHRPWTNHDGRSLDLAELRGETVVLAMVYTSCTMTCPLITREMQSVQRALPPDVRAACASCSPRSIRRAIRSARCGATWRRWRSTRGGSPCARAAGCATARRAAERQLPSAAKRGLRPFEHHQRARRGWRAALSVAPDPGRSPCTGSCRYRRRPFVQALTSRLRAAVLADSVARGTQRRRAFVGAPSLVYC